MSSRRAQLGGGAGEHASGRSRGRWRGRHSASATAEFCSATRIERPSSRLSSLQRREDVLRRPAARGPSTARRARAGAAATSAPGRSRSSAARRRRSGRTRRGASPQAREERVDALEVVRGSRRGARRGRWRRSAGSPRRSASGSSGGPRAPGPGRRGRDRRCCARVTSLPSKRIAPAVTAPRSAGRRFDTALSSVVLPAPLAPSSATISPRRTVEVDAVQRARWRRCRSPRRRSNAAGCRSAMTSASSLEARRRPAGGRPPPAASRLSWSTTSSASVGCGS